MPDAVGILRGDRIGRQVFEQEARVRVDQEDLLDAIDEGLCSRTSSANDFPVRQAVTRQRRARMDTLCSSVRFSDSTMPLSACAIALRIAQPDDRNGASASGTGCAAPTS